MASRIAFALADLRAEIEALLPQEVRETVHPIATIEMLPPVYDRLVAELRDRHSGAELPTDKTYRGQGTKPVRYSGLRLVIKPIGNAVV